MPHYYSQISLGAASAIFIFAMLLKWKPLSRIEFLIPWMLLISGIGFAAAFLSGWVRWAGGFGRQIPIFGSVLMQLLAFVLLFIVAYDLWPRHRSSKTTEVAAVLLPSFAGQLGGVVGYWASNALSWLAITGATVVAKLIGV